MRFSKKKYPLLFNKFVDYSLSRSYVSSIALSMELNDREAFKIMTHPILKKELSKTFQECVRLKRVYYVSDTFIEDSLSNSKSFTGEDGKYPERYIQEAFELPICFFDKQGLVFMGHKRAFYVFLGDFLVATIAFLLDTVRVSFCHDTFPPGQESATTLFSSALDIVLFKKYAELKEKLLPPKKKIKIFHCKYKSDFPFTVGLLNENWYTESLQGHPFVVRGHWRWQACGEKWSKRQLTWVKAHQRSKHSKGPYKEKN